jgi:uncharacterized protein
MRGGAHADENRSPAHGRRGWFDCACCPPNIMRTVSQLSGYFATTDEDGAQLHLYAPGTVRADVGGGEARLEVQTEYPWDGLVRVEVAETPGADWTLSLRVPEWAEGARIAVNGDDHSVAAGSYARVRRSWRPGDTVELSLPMEVRLVRADERVDAVRGCVAVERGPLVYAVEQVDQADGVVVDDLHLVVSGETSARYREDLLGGVTVISLKGRAGGHAEEPWPYAAADREGSPLGDEVDVTAVPYFAWANRGIGAMRVWLPRADSSEAGA